MSKSIYEEAKAERESIVLVAAELWRAAADRTTSPGNPHGIGLCTAVTVASAILVGSRLIAASIAEHTDAVNRQTDILGRAIYENARSR